MSVNINYCDTLLNALSAGYPVGSYVRTLGFATPGDGGAAMYEVTDNVTSAISNAVIDYANGTVVYWDGQFHCEIDTEHPTVSVFKLLPHNGKIYAEQFGIVPDNESCSVSNQVMLHYAALYASSKGYTLEFASKGTYYFTGGITLIDNLFIDGGGATLKFHGDDAGYTFFHLPGVAKNVTFRNATFVGRRTADAVYGDQFMWSSVKNLTMQNVTLKNFVYGLRTYGFDVESDYDQTAIVNKNWLIENCIIKDTVMGLQLSEIDGIIIKNSFINCYLNQTDKYHCIYLSSNCSNVRVTNTVLGNVSGDAIHKAYAVQELDPVSDSSKNHFYTDLSIHDADSALDIGIISENVMCDNVFATYVEIALQLSGADNCIVSNSHFKQTRPSDETTAFIFAEEACNCWMQNAYVYYEGSHRVTNAQPQASYVNRMFTDKKHRRMFLGADFDIPNHWFKFTGCKFECSLMLKYYFEHGYYNPKTTYGEFWDNCELIFSSQKDLFILKCINSVPMGITIRNSYLRNTFGDYITAPFRFCCGNANCNCLTEDLCAQKALDKTFPFIHYENNVLDRFVNEKSTSPWNDHISTFEEVNHNFIISEAVALSGSYVSNVYRLNNGVYSQMNNLM